MFPMVGNKSVLLSTIVDNFIANHRLEFDAFLNDQILEFKGGAYDDVTHQQQPEASRLTVAPEKG